MAFLTKNWILDGIVLLLTLVILAYVYMTRNSNYWRKRGIKQINPTPFFGNFYDVLMIKKSPGKLFREMYDGAAGLPYIGFFILDKPFLMVRDPDLVKHILVKDFNFFQDKHLSANPSDTLGVANLFLIKNPAWKYLRSKITPVYTAGKLKKMFELMLEVSKDLQTHLKSATLGEGEAILEVKELSAQFTTDLIASTAYGLRVNSLNDPEAEFRKNGRKIFHFTILRGFQLMAMFFAPQLLKLLNVQFFSKDTTKFLRQALWDTIIERERSGVKRPDLVDMLVDLKRNQIEEEKSIFEFDGDNLTAQAAVFFSGGFETSSTLIAFSLYEIATHPEIQDKLRREINLALKETDGQVTYEMINHLPYLDMVCSEALRMYPPLPFLDREATYDYQLPGTDIIIKKGTPIIIPMLGLHFDPEYYPNPDQFDPERFSEENKKNRRSGVYIPFGDGPHICIGMRMGLIQSKLGLVNILSKYEVSPCKQTMIPMRMNPVAVISTADGGIHLKLRKISG